ncbi:MAG: hypothetical protein OEY77_05595 [Nitrospira sp.]|nr:hypothetical protein [Nitrospira sp.]
MVRHDYIGLMSHRAAIDNLGKEGIPQEVRDEFTAIPADRIEEFPPEAFNQDIPTG